MTDNYDFHLGKRQIFRLPYPRKATQLLLWSLALRKENKETRNLSPEAPKKNLEEVQEYFFKYTESTVKIRRITRIQSE